MGTVRLSITISDDAHEVMKAISMYYHRPVKMQIEFMVEAEAERWKGPGFQPPNRTPDFPYRQGVESDLRSISDTVTVLTAEGEGNAKRPKAKANETFGGTWVMEGEEQEGGAAAQG